MKLYLTEILKEANSLGFGAPGQGGNSSNTSFSATPPPAMGNTPPPMLPQQQMGGMMMPNMNPMGMQQINTEPAKFKPSII